MARNIQDIKNSMLQNQDDRFFEIIFDKSDEELDDSLRFQEPFIDAESKFKISSYFPNKSNLTLIVTISDSNLHNAFTQWSTLQENYYYYIYARLTSPRNEQFFGYCHSVGNINNGIFEVIFMISDDEVL